MTLTQHLSTIKHWLGAKGKPVGQAVADARAEVCLRCPKHERGEYEFLTKPAAQSFKRMLEVKAEMKMRVAREDELHTCGLCLCFMPTKVWCDLDFARRVTPDWQRFPSACWLITEPLTSHDTTSV